jgi:hypothetical protein
MPSPREVSRKYGPMVQTWVVSGRMPVKNAVPGVITPGQPGGPTVGNVHQIERILNGKWVGILRNRQAKGAVRPAALAGLS